MKSLGQLLVVILMLAQAVDAWSPAFPSILRKDVRVCGMFDDFKSMGGLEKGEGRNLTPGEARSAKRKAAREAEAKAKGGSDAGVSSDSKLSAEDQIKKLKAEIDAKLP
eukprot:CAMPEP_0185767298 /NCGR_PEP_ID=MMETSP1174-20130828/41880_1 /TAXON_ID=35687 /ORGANISM="Dictyocha speculum, Strain CCMP1381" /LENGTH=108 /DNA_ID=CAMNT_0028451395 /DNA_START=23 /DNA_END=349 /DNA_ORIENTATION=-